MSDQEDFDQSRDALLKLLRTHYKPRPVAHEVVRVQQPGAVWERSFEAWPPEPLPRIGAGNNLGRAACQRRVPTEILSRGSFLTFGGHLDPMTIANAPTQTAGALLNQLQSIHKLCARILQLSSLGMELINRFRLVWSDSHQAVRQIIAEIMHFVLLVIIILLGFEWSLDALLGQRHERHLPRLSNL